MSFQLSHGLENSHYWQRVCEAGNAKMRHLGLDAVEVTLRPCTTGRGVHEPALSVSSRGVEQFEFTVNPEQQDPNIDNFVEAHFLDTIIAARHDGD